MDAKAGELQKVTVAEAYGRKLWQQQLLRYQGIHVTLIVLSEWGYIIQWEDGSFAAKPEWMLSIAESYPEAQAKIAALEAEVARLTCERDDALAALEKAWGFINPMREDVEFRTLLRDYSQSSEFWESWNTASMWVSGYLERAALRGEVTGKEDSQG